MSEPIVTVTDDQSGQTSSEEDELDGDSREHSHKMSTKFLENVESIQLPFFPSLLLKDTLLPPCVDAICESFPSADGLNIYRVGNGSRCVIWNYDIFGFNGGRTRQLCDVLGEQGRDSFHHKWQCGEPR